MYGLFSNVPLEALHSLRWSVLQSVEWCCSVWFMTQAHVWHDSFMARLEPWRWKLCTQHVLQRIKVCCSVLQCVAVCCSEFTICGSWHSQICNMIPSWLIQNRAVGENAQRVSCSMLQCVAVRCNVLHTRPGLFYKRGSFTQDFGQKGLFCQETWPFFYTTALFRGSLLHNSILFSQSSFTITKEPYYLFNVYIYDAWHYCMWYICDAWYV